ncbi:integrase catalytic domain-containing protein [Trichonephila clavipes]|nr:integrase catalytic domain-containing protein [Trichonephila clavipes]
MAPKELSELTVFNRRKANLLGQITRIRNSLENVDLPLNQVEIRTKLASLSEVKAKIDKLRTESYRVLSDEELMDFEASLDTMEVDADNLESHLRALKQLELEPNALCESMLIFVITQRLDDESRKQYEMELHSNDLPKWNNFLDFLIKRSQALENVQRNSSLKNKNEYSPKFRSFVVKSNEKSVRYVLQRHTQFLSVKCFTRCLFKKEATKVRSLNLCFNCLGHHLIKNCLKLNRKCRVCNANHNSLLCKTSVPRQINRNLLSPQSSSGVIYDPSPANVINPQTATCLYNESGEKSILLTAKVKVQSATGAWLVMNAIFDSGSQKCLCSLEASNFLGLEKYSMNSTIVGLNGACISDSVFGYIVTGSIQNEPSNYYFCNFIQDQVDRNLTKFWDLEAIGIKAESSCDPDDQAMQHFKSSVRFNSGRYEVGFP